MDGNGLISFNPMSLTPVSIAAIHPDRGVSTTDGLTNAPRLTVSGSGTPGVTFVLRVDGATAAQGQVAADSTWTLTLPGDLTQGTHLLTVETLDGSATGPGESFPARIDLTAPQVTLVGPVFSPTNAPTITVSAAALDEFGLAPDIFIDIDLNDDGDFVDEGESTIATAFLDPDGPTSIVLNDLVRGNHYLRARVNDLAGNQGISAPFRIHVAVITRVGETLPATDSPDLIADSTDLNNIIVGNFGVARVVDGLENGGGNVGGQGPPADASMLGLGPAGAVARSTQPETEPNNTAATADNITITVGDRAMIPGSINPANDLDYFRFTLTARMGMFFDIDSRETGLSTTLNSVLTLYDSSGTTVLDSNDNGYDFDTGYPLPSTAASAATADSALYRDLAAGTYFIRVSGVGTTTGNYELHIFGDPNYSATVPVLASNPSAPATLFLDFNGHSATDAWGTYNVRAFDFNNNFAEFTPGEQMAIRNIWRLVAEDYSPFNINVTTSYSGAYADRVAVRHVVGGTWMMVPGQTAGTLGVSFLGSWTMGGATNKVAFTFAEDFDFVNMPNQSSGFIMAEPLAQATTVSHEVGHQFSLGHYGGANPQPNGIMQDTNIGIARALWRRGNTSTSPGEPPVTLQDDMATISNATNGIGYRPDDHGNTRTAATVLVPTGNVYQATGIIADPANDFDFFQFIATTGGQTVIRVDVVEYINDLDPIVRVYNSAGTLLQTADPGMSFDVTINIALNNATYFVEVRGHGVVGDAGQYSLTITTPNAPPPPGPPPGSGPEDSFEPNDTSERAADMGILSGTESFTDLTITRHASGFFDQDWYRYEISRSGTLAVNLSNILIRSSRSSPGAIHVKAMQLVLAGVPVLERIASSETIGTATQQFTVGVTAGQIIYLWVYGYDFSIGEYDMTVALR